MINRAQALDTIEAAAKKVPWKHVLWAAVALTTAAILTRRHRGNSTR